MERAKFKERMKALKAYKDETGKGYWDWKVLAFDGGGTVLHLLSLGGYKGKTYAEIQEEMRTNDPESYDRLQANVARSEHPTSEIVFYKDADGNLQKATNLPHNQLDAVAEFLPGTGDVAELMELGNQIKEGNYGTALATALLAAFPGNANAIVNRARNLRSWRRSISEEALVPEINRLDQILNIQDVAQRLQALISARSNLYSLEMEPAVRSTMYDAYDDAILENTPFVLQLAENFYDLLDLHSINELTGPALRSPYYLENIIYGNNISDQALRAENVQRARIAASRRMQQQLIDETLSEVNALRELIENVTSESTRDELDAAMDMIREALSRRDDIGFGKAYDISFGADDDNFLLEHLRGTRDELTFFLNSIRDALRERWRTDFLSNTLQTRVETTSPRQTIIKPTRTEAYDPTDLPEGFDDLTKQLPGSGSGIHSLSYFGMTPQEAFKRVNSDFNSLGHGDVFDLAHDNALSTDSYPLSLMTMARHQDKGRIIPVYNSSGNNNFQRLNFFGNSTKKLPDGNKFFLTKEELLEKQIKNVRKFNKNTGLNLPDPYLDEDGFFYVPSVGFRKYANGGVVPAYGDGTGVDDDPRVQVVNRANEVASNYDNAKDFDLSSVEYGIRKLAKNWFGRGGISNCTLSATGWIDPNNQYMSARNIFNNPNSGYVEIDKEYALPGDLLISKNPEKDSYHTMLIEGFNNNEPLLRYSRGGHDTEENLVKSRPLTEYHRLDNEQGGNHTEDHYFRYMLPNEFWLPEITITPPRKIKNK